MTIPANPSDVNLILYLVVTEDKVAEVIDQARNMGMTGYIKVHSGPRPDPLPIEELVQQWQATRGTTFPEGSYVTHPETFDMYTLIDGKWILIRAAK